jgi:hypothetical protein
MGYELHIVRKNDWNNFDEESVITLNEWLSYINNDSELEPTNSNDIKAGEEQLFPWFAYWQGCISTKNPDNETVLKMLTIAEKLNAKVQGDDGEFYEENDISKIITSNNSQLPDRIPAKKKAWWKFW